MDTSTVITTLIEKEYKCKPFVLKCASALLAVATMTFPTWVSAQETDSLGGSATTTTTPSSTITTEQANEVVNKIKEAIPEASKDPALQQIVDATEKGRADSFGIAGEFAQPAIWLLMFLTNFVWYVMTALFFFSTAIDVLCIQFSGFRSFFMRQEASQQQQGQPSGNFLFNFIRSFFTLSLDAEQIIASQGMNPSTSGVGGAPMGGGFGGSAMGGGFGGSQMGGGFGGSAMGGQNQGQGQVKSGNLLAMYLKKRLLTFVLLGVSFVIFGTSWAAGFQADAVSYVMALIKMVWDWIGSWFA